MILNTLNVVELLKLLNQVDENKQAKIIQMIRLMVEEV